MSSKIFQPVINNMRENFDHSFGVIDERGVIVAGSDVSSIGTRLTGFNQDILEDDGSLSVFNGKCFCALKSDGKQIEYAVFVDGDDKNSRLVCPIFAIALNEAKANYDEKHNKAAFIKNIISDNILPGDVYVRAKELHFTTDSSRCVILVRQLDTPDVSALECVSRIFPDRQQDFVLNINEQDIVVVKSLKNDDVTEAFSYAELIQKTLKEELGISVVIGISTIANHLRELADRYKESQVAIDIGAVFDSEKTIVNYDSLGLGRIIYQLPTTLCEMFLNEVFKRNSIESLDEDTLETINRFFENNLNVSETSRKLYVHRNTLVYRLEKIKKLTGLDLREFDHAIIFKVAMMVKQYLDSLNNKH